MSRTLPHPAFAKTSRLLRLVTIAALVAVGGGGVTGCHRREERAATHAPTPVRVRTVTKPSAQVAARYSGTIAPATQVDIAFRVAGYVTTLAHVSAAGGPRRAIQEGDWVKKGTVLAQVRTADYAQKIAGASAALSEAKAARRLAELEHERATKLHAGGGIANADLDTLTAKLDSAGARVEGAAARLAEAELALSDCTLVAPIDGVVLKRKIEVGSLVGPGAVAVTLADTRSVKVVFGAPDVLVEKLRIGNPLAVSVDAVSRTIKGTVTRISPSADPKTRVFDVETLIPNPAGELRSGAIATLRLEGEALTDEGVVLPLTSIVRSPKEPRGFAVFVVVDGGEGGKEVARLRDIELGDVLGNAIYVDKGLKAGERVVSMGATLLRDGDSVSVIPSF